MKNTIKQTAKIGVVTAQFNNEYTSLLKKGALEVLREAGVEVLTVDVPGAVEIPLACELFFHHGCDAVVALGCVIRGETSHYDSVCRMAENGVLQIMLAHKKPIGFGVITTENDDQAMARCGGAHGNKGAEAAQVALEMLNKVYV